MKTEFKINLTLIKLLDNWDNINDREWFKLLLKNKEKKALGLRSFGYEFLMVFNLFEPKIS